MIVNANSIVQRVIQIKNEIKINANASLKKHHTSKKDYSWSPSTCIFNNSKYRKCIADTSVISCDENISVMDIVSTKMTNTIATYASINFHTKKVKDCYILHTVLLAMMLLLIITIICCHCALTQ